MIFSLVDLLHKINMVVCVQMVDLPKGAQGLAWIAAQGPARLLLIPGLEATSITAAALGDKWALKAVHIRAQEHAAASANKSQPSPLEQFMSAHLDPQQSSTQEQGDGLQQVIGSDAQLEHDFWQHQHVFAAQLEKAIQKGQSTAVKLLWALCSHSLRQCQVMRAAASCGNLDILRLLRSGPYPAPWDRGVVMAALPHVACLKWLITQDPPLPLRRLHILTCGH